MTGEAAAVRGVTPDGWPDNRWCPVDRSAAAVLRAIERFAAEPYLDSAGVATIGYGRVITDGAGRQIKGAGALVAARAICPHTTEPAERAWLAERIDGIARWIDGAVKVPLHGHQRAALVVWIYNVGQGAAGSSTLIRLLDQGTYEAACRELERWNIAGGQVSRGLQRRRHVEQALWRTPPDREFDAAAASAAAERAFPS